MTGREVSSMKNGRLLMHGLAVAQNLIKSSLCGLGFCRPYLNLPNTRSCSLYTSLENEPLGSFGSHVPYVVNTA